MCLYVLSSVFVDPGFFYGVRVAHIFSFFVLSCYVSLCSEFRVVVSVTIFAYKRCSIRLYLQLLVVGFMSYIRYLREGVCGFFFLSTVACLLSFFISSLSFLYQTQPLITTLVSWNFSLTKTGILTVMEDTTYDHQQTKLCHILQMIK